jgi:hypothetical protein
MWLSYLQLEAGAGDLDYDLAVSADPNGEPSIDDAGVGPASVVPIVVDDAGPALWPLVAGIATGIAAIVGLASLRRRSVVGQVVAP